MVERGADRATPQEPAQSPLNQNTSHTATTARAPRPAALAECDRSQREMREVSCRRGGFMPRVFTVARWLRQVETTMYSPAPLRHPRAFPQ
jgi:hypothetical protein